MNAADLMGRGVQAFEMMMRLLDEEDAAIRFWAASALGTLGPEARPATDRLTARLRDSSPVVRSAAAEALCRLGDEAIALPILIRALKSEDPWAGLHAANSLQYLGEMARPVLPQIEELFEQKADGPAALYIHWGLSHLLDEVNP
jgi:HEAT repeat protein